MVPSAYVQRQMMSLANLCSDAIAVSQLPWSEDWIWQTPVGSKCSSSFASSFEASQELLCTGQQMMQLSIDAMRSGVLWADEPDTVSAELRASTRSTGAYVRLPRPAKHTSMLMYVMKHFRESAAFLPRWAKG